MFLKSFVIYICREIYKEIILFNVSIKQVVPLFLVPRAFVTLKMAA